VTDDGTADPALLAALATGDPAEILPLLHTARLLVAVIAIPGQDHASEGEMALALLESGDGRKALPAFTGLAALAVWSADARPVPRPASEVIAYAIEESLAAIVIDPGSPHTWTLWGAELGGYARPSWRPSRRARKAAAPHEVYAIDTSAGEPAVAIICPDGTLDADWAQVLLAACPPGTAVLALPADSRPAVQQVGLALTSRRSRSTLT
jgi:hypothetical protein